MSEAKCVHRYVCRFIKGECRSECGYYTAEALKPSHNSAMDEICGECGSLIKKHWKYCQECKSAMTAVGRKHRQ
jgi:hypothetical protein